MESPLKILQPKDRIPFMMTDFVRLVVLIPVFGMSIVMILTDSYMVWYTRIMGSFFFCMSGYFLLDIFVLKRRRLRELQYVFYSDRLVIYDKSQDKEVHSFDYRNFPPMTFHENLNNFGYIVIGNHEELIARRSGALRWGVNMKDHEVMLENLPNVRKEYEFLKGLIDLA